MRYNDEVLKDIDEKVKTLSGDHYDTLKTEFVDFHNDLRVATVREVTDLGIPRETAENVLYYLREVARGIDGTMRTKYAEDVAPAEEVAA
jgi:uncharacterized protein YecE (DUF72 family)